MDISICIKGGDKDRCVKVVESIRKHQDQEYEICIATSKQDVYDALEGLDVVRSMVFSTNPPGDFADVQNESVRIATNSWVWLWDDDHFATSRFNPPKKLVAGVVYSNMLVEPGNRPVSSYLINRDFGKTLDTIDFDALNRFVESYPTNGTIRLGQVSYPVLLEKSAYQKVNGVDPLFNRAYANDPDLWYRLKIAGYRFVRLTDSFMYHLQGQTNATLNNNDEEKRRLTEYYCNTDFIRKWKEPIMYSFGGPVTTKAVYHRGQEGYNSITGFVDVKYLDHLIEIEPFMDHIILYSTESISEDIVQSIENFKNQLIQYSAYPADVFNKFEFIITSNVKETIPEHKKTTFNYLYQGNKKELLMLRGLTDEN